MKIFGSIFGWIFGLFFLFLFLLSLISGHYIPSILMFVSAIIVIPQIREKFSRCTHIPLPVWLRCLLIPIFLIVFVFMIFSTMGNPLSIYKTPELQKDLMAIYDQRMDQWPVPYEAKYISTKYGKVHIIISGPEDAPPLILLHASAMGGWSWLYNIKGLNKYYRTYAIDTIGDAGRSELDDASIFPMNGKAYAELYTLLMDSLQVDKAVFMGASQGGFISTNMALHHPERVEKLILSGPMGYTGTHLSVMRILFTSMFPIDPVQKSATEWAFGDNPVILKEVGDWFALILEGVISRQGRPQPFTQEQLKSLKMPVLLLLGTKDGLVGNPENAIQFVKDIPSIQVEILETGHLVSAEKPDLFNQLVIDFIEK